MVPQLLMGMCQIKEYYMTTLINSEKKKNSFQITKEMVGRMLLMYAINIMYAINYK
jgi:hypothetical protein